LALLGRVDSGEADLVLGLESSRTVIVSPSETPTIRPSTIHSAARAVPRARARIAARKVPAMANEKLFAEFKAYWQIADELLEKATKQGTKGVRHHRVSIRGNLPLLTRLIQRY